MNPKKASKKKLMQKITETQQAVSRPLTPPFDVDLGLVEAIRARNISPAEVRLQARQYRAMGRTRDFPEAARVQWLKLASQYKKAAQYMERSF